MDSEAVLLLETVNFAAEKHRNQRRKDADGTPYINHPIATILRQSDLYQDCFLCFKYLCIYHYWLYSILNY
uniref:HD domain-containing protein n=1 Tax=Seriola lalandi dorsalis TaxID=1841481 RepID=A0A3B4WJ82_SERLL